MYNIFIDDIRDPTHVNQALHRDDGWREFPSHYSWEVVRNYEQFVQLITSRMDEGEFPSVISFDHDLGLEHYPKGELTLTPIDYSKFTEKTGYDCAKWLIEFCIKYNQALPEWYVHSFNPVGRMNIANVLVRYQQYINETPTLDPKDPKSIIS